MGSRKFARRDHPQVAALVQMNLEMTGAVHINPRLHSLQAHWFYRNKQLASLAHGKLGTITIMLHCPQKLLNIVVGGWHIFKCSHVYSHVGWA